MSERTEEPTPRRLRRAREEGDSGASPYAAQAVAFIAAVALVPAALRALVSRAGADLREALARVAVHGGGARVDTFAVASHVVVLAGPPLVGAAVAGAVALALQTGGVIATRRLAPRLDRLDIVAGLRGLVSGARAFAALRAVVAGLAVGWLATGVLYAHLGDVARLAGRGRGVADVAGAIAGALAWRAAFVGLALGAADVFVTRRAWTRRLRMTKEEVKREHRDAEGDPQLKAARERAYHELAAQATIAGVRTASVVVVNPTHLACALRYDGYDGYDARSGDEAPLVVASGEGALAARIARTAVEYGVPVVRDVPLARALRDLHVGDAIPEGLYEAVAEVLREIGPP